MGKAGESVQPSLCPEDASLSPRLITHRAIAGSLDLNILCLLCAPVGPQEPPHSLRPYSGYSEMAPV